MRHYISLAFFTLFICSPAIGQEKKIQSDRPSQSHTPELTQKGFIQTELGFEREQQKKDNYTLFHPQLQLKYGLSQRFELRAEITAESEKQSSKDEFNYGIRPVELGFKVRILEEKGAIPSTSFYTQVGIPQWASKDHQTVHAIPKVRLLFENKLLDKLRLNYNIGAEWNGEETSPVWLYTITPEIELSEKWEAFIEVFGYLQTTKAPQHHLDGGFGYYATDHLKLDVYGGIGLNKESPDYFISAGLSFRIKP